MAVTTAGAGDEVAFHLAGYIWDGANMIFG